MARTDVSDTVIQERLERTRDRLVWGCLFGGMLVGAVWLAYATGFLLLAPIGAGIGAILGFGLAVVLLMRV